MTTATARTRDHDHDEERRRELASFLRSRRERLTPAAVGLPAVGRRRTPGLRREEVAQLAGTGVPWTTLLVDWEDTATRLIAQYRAAMASHVGEPAWSGPVEELRAASARFREFWDRHEVSTRSSRIKRYLHPVAGLVTLEVTRLWLS